MENKKVLIYIRNSDGTIDCSTIIGYGGELKNIEIPGEKNGIKLTTIADSAFRFSGLTNVVIPNSVINIVHFMVMN